MFAVQEELQTFVEREDEVVHSDFSLLYPFLKEEESVFLATNEEMFVFCPREKMILFVVVGKRGGWGKWPCWGKGRQRKRNISLPFLLASFSFFFFFFFSLFFFFFPFFGG